MFVSITQKKTRASVLGCSVATVLLAGCAGYAPGQKTYWDSQIQQMCEREGKIQILERVTLSRKEADAMPRADGKITTRPSRYGDPVYSRREITYLRDASPRVSREEVTVVRRLDERPVARWVEYARVGGDLPTGLAHDSSFRCPNPTQRLEELQQLFVVRE